MNFRFICLCFLVILVTSPPSAFSQENTRVSWYVFDTGFGVTKSDELSILSAAGQMFVGPASGSENLIQSGFLADTLMRGVLVDVREADALPLEFGLHQNYPNPFNPVTAIRFEIPRTTRVRLSLYTILGQEVDRLVDDILDAGAHTVTLDAGSLASGVYFYRLSTEGFVAVKKLVVAK